MCMFMLILPIEGEWGFDVGLRAQIVRQHDGITATTQYRICHPRRHSHSEACRFTLGRPFLLVRYAAYGTLALGGLYGDAENRFQALGGNPSRVGEVDLVVEALPALVEPQAL